MPNDDKRGGRASQGRGTGDTGSGRPARAKRPSTGGARSGGSSRADGGARGQRGATGGTGSRSSSGSASGDRSYRRPSGDERSGGSSRADGGARGQRGATGGTGSRSSSGSASGDRSRQGSSGVERKAWSPDGDLPRWVQDEISRVTAKQRIGETVTLLQAAAKAFADGRHGRALRDAEAAKELAPRVATVREVLGLAAYRLGRWDVALRELRTFRRFTGETTHMPVEMDVLRALDRPKDVEEVWTSFRRLGGDRETEREARVVYGSFLLDTGDDRKAWEVTNPKRLSTSPEESELRVWFVAARAAARLGDVATGRRLYEAIQAADPGFPALDELDRATSGR